MLLYMRVKVVFYFFFLCMYNYFLCWLTFLLGFVLLLVSVSIVCDCMFTFNFNMLAHFRFDIYCNFFHCGSLRFFSHFSTFQYIFDYMVFSFNLKLIGTFEIQFFPLFFIPFSLAVWCKTILTLNSYL